MGNGVTAWRSAHRPRGPRWEPWRGACRGRRNGAERGSPDLQLSPTQPPLVRRGGHFPCVQRVRISSARGRLRVLMACGWAAGIDPVGPLAVVTALGEAGLIGFWGFFFVFFSII